MQSQYSIAIQPSEAVNALVKRMKERLADAVGWFPSKSSAGHITICVFEANEEEIETIKRQLIKLCEEFSPVEVWLTDFGSFENGAFFIAPDSDSKDRLVPIMQKINSALAMENWQTSDDPHLSIARRLSPEKLKTARRMFTSVNVRFRCDNVILRKFDPEVKQYHIAEVFPFS